MGTSAKKEFNDSNFFCGFAQQLWLAEIPGIVG